MGLNKITNEHSDHVDDCMSERAVSLMNGDIFRMLGNLVTHAHLVLLNTNVTSCPQLLRGQFCAVHRLACDLVLVSKAVGTLLPLFKEFAYFAPHLGFFFFFFGQVPKVQEKIMLLIKYFVLSLLRKRKVFGCIYNDILC